MHPQCFGKTARSVADAPPKQETLLTRIRAPWVVRLYEAGVFVSRSQVYEERFERTYGFLRPYLRKVIYRYLDCGDLHNGFARVKCKDCNHEYLLAFSCKRRHFCPSCHQKRVAE